MPRISVIVPVYNVNMFLDRCIKSILNQSFFDFELLLVDDGSPDVSGGICDQYSQIDSRIIVIHKRNGGLSDARNKGIDYSYLFSNSEWITFIDSDDWVHTDYLKALYNVAIKSNCRVIVCGYQKISDEVKSEKKYSDEYTIVNVEDFYCEGNISFIVAWGKLYKKDLYENIRYPVNKLHEDEYVTYKILFSLNSVALNQDKLYFYFFNEDSITANWRPKRLDSLEALRDQIDFFQENGFERAYNKSIINAAINILNNYIRLNETECITDKEKYKKILSDEMNRLFRYKGAKSILPFTQYWYLYEIAYPKLMKYYWYLRSIITRIKG